MPWCVTVGKSLRHSFSVGFNTSPSNEYFKRPHSDTQKRCCASWAEDEELKRLWATSPLEMSSIWIIDGLSANSGSLSIGDGSRMNFVPVNKFGGDRHAQSGPKIVHRSSEVEKNNFVDLNIDDKKFVVVHQRKLVDGS